MDVTAADSSSPELTGGEESVERSVEVPESGEGGPFDAGWSERPSRASVGSWEAATEGA